jgi:hypothetical protein
MIDIPAEYLQILRSAGLYAEAKAHVVLVYQSCHQVDGNTVIDGPPLEVSRDGEDWVVAHNHWIGRGASRPPDFRNHWKTPQEAMADILGFYFGDPGRIEACRR